MSLWDQVYILFKFSRCDLHFGDFKKKELLLNRCTDFVEIGSYMHLSMVSKISSNQVRLTYFHQIMLMSFLVVTEHAYLQCILRVCLIENKLSVTNWSLMTTVPLGTFITKISYDYF